MASRQSRQSRATSLATAGQNLRRPFVARISSPAALPMGDEPSSLAHLRQTANCKKHPCCTGSRAECSCSGLPPQPRCPRVVTSKTRTASGRRCASVYSRAAVAPTQLQRRPLPICKPVSFSLLCERVEQFKMAARAPAAGPSTSDAKQDLMEVLLRCDEYSALDDSLHHQDMAAEWLQLLTFKLSCS